MKRPSDAMPAKFWTCRKCGGRTERRFLKCQTTWPETCAGRRPPRRVPKHAVALRDMTHAEFAAVNEAIHGQGSCCGVCGAPPKDERNLQREHDHTTGKPRGLACWRCNRLMPKQFDLAHARLIVAYLERVETYYAGRVAE